MSIKINIGLHKNKNILYINKLIDFLNKELINYLFGAYIFGSYATNEQLRYSDFDGLLIIDDDVLNEESKRNTFNTFVNKSLKIIYKIDPLQHHGWFIMYKSQLLNYPQTYFPYEVFEHSKSLLNKNLAFEIQLPENIDYFTPFTKLKDHLSLIINKRKPKNLYQLKSFLSGLMLMPSLYLQAKSNKGCYKKNSFDLAKIDFTEKEWEPIVIASHIRLNWDYNLNYIQRFIMTRPYKLFRKLTKYIIAPGINEQYSELLSNEFYSKSKELLEIMDVKLTKLNAEA